MKNKISGIIEIEDIENSRVFYGIFERPKLETENTPLIGYSTWMPIRTVWSNIELKFYDCGDDKDFKWLDDWSRLHAESIVGRFSYISNLKKNINIKVLNSINGAVIEKWELFGAFILDFEIVYHSECDLITFNKLTRNVLFEKINHPTMQICKKITINIDNASLLMGIPVNNY